MQNRHNFWAKEAGFMPATVAPGPGAVLEPDLPNPLTRTGKRFGALGPAPLE